MAERCDLPLIVLDDLYWRDGPIPSEHEWAIKHGSRWQILVRSRRGYPAGR